MNYDLLKGTWNEVKDRLKVRWSNLTDGDLKLVEGSHAELAGVLQQRYSLPKDKAETDSKAFFVGMGAKAEPLAGPTVAKPATSAPGAQPAKAVASAPATKTNESKI